MATLSAHLRRVDDHGRLGFHPDCGQCRDERLWGHLPLEPLVSRRTQAALTAGVLALTSVAPTAAFAADDQEYEGTAAPEQVVAETENEFDPGGDSGQLWQDGGEAPGDAGEVPAAEAPNAPAAAPDPAEAAPEAPEAVAPAEPALEAPAEPGVAEATPAPAEPAATPAPEAVEPAESAPAAEENFEREAKPRKKRADRPARRVKRVAVAPAPVAPAAAAPAVAAAPAPRARVVAVAAPAGQAGAIGAGDESYVVQRGDSLWSIAADALGDDASPARVAREVNRLWELNKSRIGTGDRNLLMAGTRLELA